MAKNKLTAEIMDGIYEAFERVGGVDYLIEIARKDPPTFCRLLAKLIPQQIEAKINTTNIDLGVAMAIAGKRVEQFQLERSNDND
ncbi:hypothetical protein [Sneathiella sp.]|uniref:hypothetical protein n=1 Tax=Sneathiella sp. TaxID=1964365 RepID=UPI00356B3A9E